MKSALAAIRGPPQEERLLHYSIKLAGGLLCLMAAGCGLYQGVHLDPEAAAKLEDEVKIYQASDLAKLDYAPYGPIQITSCKYFLWDHTPTEKDVMSQVLYQAKTMQANGVTNVVCGSTGLNALVRDCYYEMRCNANAIKVKGQAPSAS